MSSVWSIVKVSRRVLLSFDALTAVNLITEGNSAIRGMETISARQ